MSIFLTDNQILKLEGEPKRLHTDFNSRIILKPKRGHKERELDVKGDAGSDFKIILRQSDMNILAFSVILIYLDPNSNAVLRLRRYNGKSHFHTNVIENQPRFYDFHIHYATERYQQGGWAEDHYAEITDRFYDYNGALGYLYSDCGFILLPNYPPS